MGEIENINNHMAKACECGSVNFNLLKSGLIECANCGVRFGEWKDTPSCKKCNDTGLIFGAQMGGKTRYQTIDCDCKGDKNEKV